MFNISTSVWVLSTPSTGRNMLFPHFLRKKLGKWNALFAFCVASFSDVIFELPHAVISSEYEVYCV